MTIRCKQYYCDINCHMIGCLYSVYRSLYTDPFLQVKQSFKMEREPSDDSDLDVSEPTKQSSDHQQEDQPHDIDDLLGNHTDVTDYHDNRDDDKVLEEKPKKTRKKKSHKKKHSEPEEPSLISFDDEVVATPPSAPPPSQSTGGYGSTGGTMVNPNANLLDDWSSEDWGTGWDSEPTKDKKPSNGGGCEGGVKSGGRDGGVKSGGRDGGVKSGGWASEDWSDWGNEWNSVDLKAD